MAALLVGGVFAWRDFSQSYTNIFRGLPDGADVTLHDEFDEKGDGRGNFDKHVFAENSGDSPIYVRIRLDEYMKIGEDGVFSMEESAVPDIKDKRTWIPHRYSEGEDGICDCGQSDAGSFHEYYEWEITGNARPFTPGTPGLVYTALKDDGSGGKEVDKGIYFPGGTKERPLTAGSSAPILLSYYLELLEREVDGGATLDELTEEEELLLAGAREGCWLLDEDGWAYWSVALMPGEATNLLLEKVTLLKDPDEDWIYRIDVKLQAVTLGDTGKWDEEGWSTSEPAKELINLWNAEGGPQGTD